MTRTATKLTPILTAPTEDGKGIDLDAVLLPLRTECPSAFVCDGPVDPFSPDLLPMVPYIPLAAIGMCWAATSVDENGVGINYAQRHTIDIRTAYRERALDTLSQTVKDLDAGHSIWLSCRYSEAARRISRWAGHPYWMNAPLTALGWVNAGFPGLTVNGCEVEFLIRHTAVF